MARPGGLGDVLVASPTAPDPDINRAQALVVQANVCASDDEIADALAVLAKLTGKYEGGDSEEGQLELEAFTAKLKPYPRDIVLHVLDKWADTAAWPKWDKLKAKLDAAFAFRRQLLPALAICGQYRAPDADGKTVADKAEVRALASAVAGKLRAHAATGITPSSTFAARMAQHERRQRAVETLAAEEEKP